MTETKSRKAASSIQIMISAEKFVVGGVLPEDYELFGSEEKETFWQICQEIGDLGIQGIAMEIPSEWPELILTEFMHHVENK